MKRRHISLRCAASAWLVALALAGDITWSHAETAADSTAPREPMVIDAYRLGQEKSSGLERVSAGIGDIVVVQVRGLQTLLNRAQCLEETGARKPECIDQKIVLCLDGRLITGITPEASDAHSAGETLQFHLLRDEDNDEAWADLLGNPPWGKKFFLRDTRLSVGLENGYIVPSMIQEGKFKLIRMKTGRFWAGIGGLLLLLGVMIYLSLHSDIVRDAGPDPAGVDRYGKTKRKPYSLSRCQLAFWFFLVIASFLFLWSITGAYDIITSSVLALIGIGSGTALGAAVIDSSKKTAATNELTALEAEQTVLDRDINTREETTASGVRSFSDAEATHETRAMKSRLVQVNRQMSTLETTVGPQESHGFIRDVLSDSTGISLHRLQMFVWTIVLGIIFISSVWKRLAMPEFSATLLALQGLSAGTYLGFKMPEKQN